MKYGSHCTYNLGLLQCVPLTTEPGISLIILTPVKILQWNLNRGMFIVWEMKRNVSVGCVCGAPNCCDTEQRPASQPGSVASGTPYGSSLVAHLTLNSCTSDRKHCLTSWSIWEGAHEFCTKWCMKVCSFEPCNCSSVGSLQWCLWKGSCLSRVLKDVELQAHQLCSVGLKLQTICQECLY
jgi:hypothetical protein